MRIKYDIPEILTISESASAACEMLKVLTNEDRLLILCQLSQGDRNVGGLEKSL